MLEFDEESNEEGLPGRALNTTPVAAMELSGHDLRHATRPGPSVPVANRSRQGPCAYCMTRKTKPTDSSVGDFEIKEGNSPLVN